MEQAEIEQELIQTLGRLGKMHMGNLFQGITRGEFSVLIVLEQYEKQHRAEGIKASRLAQLAEASPQALSRTLRGLESKGYVRRMADPRDRRNTCICLTESAHDVMEAGKRRMNQLLGRVVAEMGEEEIRELIVRLNRLVDVVRRVGAEENTNTPGSGHSLKTL